MKAPACIALLLLASCDQPTSQTDRDLKAFETAGTDYGLSCEYANRLTRDYLEAGDTKQAAHWRNEAKISCGLADAEKRRI